MDITEDFRSRSKYSDIARWYVSRFILRASSEIPEGSRVLDAGAGECVYKREFSHCRYMAVDLAVGSVKWNYHNLDIISMLDSLPLKDNAFDAVVCTQVLEHLEYPRRCVAELYRVTKPGGVLYMTVPMSHAEHQVPYDFFRFTSFGIVSVCKGAGFSEVEVEPQGGAYVRWAKELPRLMKLFPGSRDRDGRFYFTGAVLSLFKKPARLFISLLQRILVGLDRYDTEKNFPMGWTVVARKGR